MMTTDLGACEWFVWDLRRSNLIDRGQLDQVIGEFLGKNPGAEPPALAEYLVAQGVLTEFQAERLLQGKTQGFVLGPFTLMDALGTGSMGTVYKAQSKNDNGWYAVKVLPRRSMWNVRIARRKVRSFEQCQHPAVVPFVDVGTSGGMHYLAWPLVEGTPLDKVVEPQGKLTPEQTALYALQAAEGLELCHQQGLFHGLLKPSNLMVGPDGQLRILDFGIGCLLAETEGESLVDTMSTANSVNSGLDCASPESIMDPTNLTPVGDQYSLGCVMYYCLTGQYPFPDGTAVEKMMCHQTKQPAPVKQLAPGTPDALAAVVERLMQKNPSDRYGSCAELIDALRPFAAGLVSAARRTMSMPRVTAQAPGVPPVRPSAQGGLRPSAQGGARPSAQGAVRPPTSLVRPSSQGVGPRPSAQGTGPGVRPSAQGTGLNRPGAVPPVAPLARPAPPRPGSFPKAPAAVPVALPTAPESAAARLPRPGSFPKAPGVSAPAAARSETPWVPPAPSDEVSEAPRPASLGQRLGTVGLVLVAFLAGAVAWMLSSFIKF